MSAPNNYQLAALSVQGTPSQVTEHPCLQPHPHGRGWLDDVIAPAITQAIIPAGAAPSCCQGINNGGIGHTG